MQKILNAEDFGKLMRCISILKDKCNDAEIVDGFIRQRTNTYSSIFEMDLNPLIGCVNIPMTCLKQKIDILKTFNKCDVELNIEDGYYMFMDQHSKIKFDYPNMNYIDNKYIPLEEYETMFQINPEDLILEYDIEKVITDRIKKISQAFDITTVKIIFKNNKASIVANSQSRDQEAEFLSDIEILNDLDCNANIIITPFIIDHDSSVKMSIYETDNNSCNCVFKTKISDVDISISCSSPLLEDDF